MIYYTDKWKIPFEIDDDDYDLISRYRWYVCDKYIATWSEIYINGLPFKGPLFLHNFLMGRPPKGFEVDHIDRNKMNYRRLNLRIVTRGKNMYNRNIMRTESGYFGVHRNGRGWVSFLSPFEILQIKLSV